MFNAFDIRKIINFELIVSASDLKVKPRRM